MFEPGQDQASGLRQLLQQPPLRLLPVIGAAGDGARQVATGIAQALVENGCRTLLVTGGREAAVAHGTRAALRHVALPDRFGRSGVAAGAAAWLEALPIAHKGYELAVVAAPEVLLGPMLARLRPETLVLCGPRREDLASAYALVKRLARGHGFCRFRLLFEGLDDPALALPRQRRLAGVAARYLGVDVGFAGRLDRNLGAGRQCDDVVAAPADAVTTGADLAPVARAVRSWSLATVGARSPLLH